MALIKLLLEKASQHYMNNYLVENAFSPKEEFHTTLVYAEETPLFIRDNSIDMIKSVLPIRLHPPNYQLDIFDNNLVLKYQDTIVERVHSTIMGEALKHSIHGYEDLSEEELDILSESLKQKRQAPIYANLNSHITLAKKFQGDFSKIPLPKMQLMFDRVSWKVLKTMKSSPEMIIKR